MRGCLSPDGFQEARISCTRHAYLRRPCRNSRRCDQPSHKRGIWRPSHQTAERPKKAAAGDSGTERAARAIATSLPINSGEILSKPPMHLASLSPPSFLRLSAKTRLPLRSREPFAKSIGCKKHRHGLQRRWSKRPAQPTLNRVRACKSQPKLKSHIDPSTKGKHCTPAVSLIPACLIETMTFLQQYWHTTCEV